jgi:hypothetical protein
MLVPVNIKKFVFSSSNIHSATSASVKPSKQQGPFFKTEIFWRTNIRKKKLEGLKTKF